MRPNLSGRIAVRFVLCLVRIVARCGPGERGIATISIALLAFLAIASTVASVTIAEGDINFQAIQDLVDDSVNRVGATLEVRGSIIARSDPSATSVTAIQIPLRVYGEGKPVPLDAAEPEHLVIAYQDDAIYNPDVPYSFESLSGDGDATLTAGEMALITVNTADLAVGGVQPSLAANSRFTLELSAPIGGTLIVSRRLPFGLQPVMSLY